MQRLKFHMVILIASFVCGPVLAQTVDGTWRVQDGNGEVTFAPCGGKVCGRLTWLEEPNRPDGSPKRDMNNPEAGQRDRLLCGLQIVGDMNPNGPGSWNDGWIYDPSDGTTYQSKMALQPDGTLEVRGFVGISLFGKSQVWTRKAQPGSCPK